MVEQSSSVKKKRRKFQLIVIICLPIISAPDLIPNFTSYKLEISSIKANTDVNDI